MYKEIVEIVGASLVVGYVAYETAMYLMLSKECREKGRLRVLRDVILHPIRSRNEIEDLEVRLIKEE